MYRYLNAERMAATNAANRGVGERRPSRFKEAKSEALSPRDSST